MSKINKMDFILHDDEFETVVFRFRPSKSSCHGFYDDPPSCWDEVYQVYYSYSIFVKYKYDNSSELLFDCPYDEDSMIGELASRCSHIADGQTSVDLKISDNDNDERCYTLKLLDNEFHPIGYGVHWDIKHIVDDLYVIYAFRQNGVGYRFRLNQKRMREFADYLNKCCEYMLAHGEGI